MKSNGIGGSNPQGILKAGQLRTLRYLLLDVYNNPKKYADHEYKEQDTLFEDLKELIKSCVKYGVQFRYTNPESIKQFAYVDKKDNRIKLLGMKGNCLKSDTIFHFSRLKYVIAHGQHKMSILALQRIIGDRKKIKEIDIDHINNNTFDNRLINLQAVPHKINISGKFDTLKRLTNSPAQAKKYAKEHECEHLLPFVL